MPSKRVKIAVVLVVILAVTAGAWYKYGRQQPTDGSSGLTTSHPTYRLVIQDPRAYVVGESNDVSFQIKDNEGKILKDVEPTHGDRVHAVVVRKDRSQFQYLAADYQESSGTYILRNLTLPTDGEYRLFIDFTPKNAQIGPEGLPLPVTTLYVDLKTGDLSKYQPQSISAERFADSYNGFDLDVFLAPHDPSDPGLIAKATSSFAVSVNKNDKPFKQLQSYQGSRGSLMMFGPNLEFLHTHSQNDEVPNTYVLSFSVDFPTSGYYKAFLQTKANNMVNDTDYALLVGELPDSSTPKPNMSGH